MVPTKQEIEKQVQKLATLLDKTTKGSFEFIKETEKFNSTLQESHHFWKDTIKKLAKEKKREIELYMLRKQLIYLNNRIKEEERRLKKQGEN